MSAEYTKQMKVNFYDSEEIEIVDENPENDFYLIYFKNKYQLAELINSSPKLAKELKELLE